jgi:large subunit ribosomal protein L14e
MAVTKGKKAPVAAVVPGEAKKPKRSLQITKSGRPFSKFVEIGRVVFIAHGKHKGKLATIVDIIDQNRALIDGPCSKVKRQAYLLKRLHLTRFRLKFPHSCKSKVIRKTWEKNDVTGKWNETKWAKRLERRKLKSGLSDFERYKLRKLKQIRNRIVLREFFRLRKTYRKGVHSRIQTNLEKQKVLKEEAKAKRKAGGKKPTEKQVRKSVAKRSAAKKAAAAKAKAKGKKTAGGAAPAKGKK